MIDVLAGFTKGQKEVMKDIVIKIRAETLVECLKMINSKLDYYEEQLKVMSNMEFELVCKEFEELKQKIEEKKK